LSVSRQFVDTPIKSQRDGCWKKKSKHDRMSQISYFIASKTNCLKFRNANFYLIRYKLTSSRQFDEACSHFTVVSNIEEENAQITIITLITFSLVTRDLYLKGRVTAR
jgi:hypothetical protein